MSSLSNLTWAGEIALGFVNKRGQSSLQLFVEEMLDALKMTGGLDFGKTMSLKAQVKGATISLFNDDVTRLRVATGSALAEPFFADATQIVGSLKGQRSFQLLNPKGIFARNGSALVEVKNWGSERTLTALDRKPLFGSQLWPTRVGALPSPYEIRVSAISPHFSRGLLPEDQIGATVLKFDRPTSLPLTPALVGAGEKEGTQTVLQNVTSVRIPDVIGIDRLPIVTLEENGQSWVGALPEAVKRAIRQ